MIIFSSKVVIESARRLAGTSEDISEYLTVSSPADSNIVELKVVKMCIRDSIKRVRNSSLVERSCAENVRG